MAGVFGEELHQATRKEGLLFLPDLREGQTRKEGVDLGKYLTSLPQRGADTKLNHVIVVWRPLGPTTHELGEA